MDKFLTPKDVAKILGVCTKTIRRLINKGELPASKIGGRWRVRQEVLDTYIRAREVFFWDISIPPLYFLKQVLDPYRKDSKYYIQESSFHGRVGLREDKYLVHASKSLEWIEKRRFSGEGLFSGLKFWKVPLRDGSFCIAVDPRAFNKIPEAEQNKWTPYRISHPQI